MANEWLEHGFLPNKRSLNNVNKQRRHVGPPDHGGFQRLIQTGSIAATFSGNQSKAPKGIDVMMVTYWMYPAKVRIITDKEQECIEHYRNLSRKGMKIKPNVKRLKWVYSREYYTNDTRRRFTSHLTLPLITVEGLHNTLQ